MGYLLINNINDENLQLYENKKSYSLNYNTEYLKLNKLAFEINDIIISESQYYYMIKLTNELDINNINKINEFLKKNDIKPILHDFTIRFKKTEIIKKLINVNQAKITFCIYTIKKNAYQSVPILYII